LDSLSDIMWILYNIKHKDLKTWVIQ
jgi:hypothetical protein